MLIAAPAPGLVETEARHWPEGIRFRSRRTELLRLNAWRASRSGLDHVLINPLTSLPEQAAAVANLLLDHVRGALDEAGEMNFVSLRVGQTVRGIRCGPVACPLGC